jgi:hypothetical protein
MERKADGKTFRPHQYYKDEEDQHLGLLLPGLAAEARGHAQQITERRRSTTRV